MLYKYNIHFVMRLHLPQLFAQQAPNWVALNNVFDTPQMKSLEDFLNERYNVATLFPERENIFKAYSLTPLQKVKVVIVGQDPYHGPNQAHGLSFSVLEPIPAPPSLRNMFKELTTDLNIATPTTGNLTPWAMQGVFLLNSVLTVEQANANAHKGKGWEILTQKTIEVISDQQENVVFVLWGGHAQRLKKFIDSKKHFIIESPHPSPLSSYRGFFGSKPYSQTNAYLEENNITPINWALD